ncbi:MAG: NADH-quinone oxidoreductase subunit NuoB, partial [Dehalococcoidia bacterium]
MRATTATAAMASDLRIIIAILNITTEIERIGDYAVGIARIVIMIGDEPPLKPLIDIPRMAEKTVDMLRRSLDAFINWARRNSLWPLAFGTKCCAIEMLMATGAPHQDLSRFGAEVARQSPRQADFMVVAGAIVKKMAPRMRLLYEQMAEPRYVMATGSCAISGGPFMYNSYTIIR